jgi:hypothetical protein
MLMSTQMGIGDMQHIAKTSETRGIAPIKGKNCCTKRGWFHLGKIRMLLVNNANLALAACSVQ